jgi:Excalibur calcium-binding domain
MGRRKKASNGGSLIGLTIALMGSLAIGYWKLLNRIIGWIPWLREKEEVYKNLIAALITITLIWLYSLFQFNQPKEITTEPSNPPEIRESVRYPIPAETTPQIETVNEPSPSLSPSIEVESVPDEYSRKVTCKDFSRQWSAYPYMSSNPRLDRDRDGIPCENLPP